VRLPRPKRLLKTRKNELPCVQRRWFELERGQDFEGIVGESGSGKPPLATASAETAAAAVILI